MFLSDDLSVLSTALAVMNRRSSAALYGFSQERHSSYRSRNRLFGAASSIATSSRSANRLKGTRPGAALRKNNVYTFLNMCIQLVSMHFERLAEST